MNDHSQSSLLITKIALIVALGGFLMGFDASVISGVIKFIELEFALTKIQIGWAVSSLSLVATFAMLVSGPLSDRFGRKPVLKVAALLFLISAIASAFASSYTMLVAARMLGGLGVGAALIIAPMYIAEMSPAKIRGRMVSMNQLNIVIGISVAFFSNYLILQWSQENTGWISSLGIDQHNWRWMLGVEAIPALFYLIFLYIVPESPRWLVMQGRQSEAKAILQTLQPNNDAEADIADIENSLKDVSGAKANKLSELFNSKMKLVMIVGISIAVLQQITGINAVFFYAPMIFEQSGIGTDAAFMQAVAVGLVNLVFTFVAIYLIDKLGRRQLLVYGVSGIVLAMLSLSHGFYSARYQITQQDLVHLSDEVKTPQLMAAVDKAFDGELAYKAGLREILGNDLYQANESSILKAGIKMNQTQVLVSILAFVACFAFSLGPVMWVLFSELFPNYIRGLAISFVGLVNSGVSFGVQFIFPWELATIGSAATFFIFGVFAAVGLLIILKYLPETKGKSLEELEHILVK